MVTLTGTGTSVAWSRTASMTSVLALSAMDVTWIHLLSATPAWDNGASETWISREAPGARLGAVQPLAPIRAPRMLTLPASTFTDQLGILFVVARST